MMMTSHRDFPLKLDNGRQKKGNMTKTLPFEVGVNV